MAAGVFLVVIRSIFVPFFLNRLQTLSLKTPLAPRTGGGQDARPAQKSETRLAREKP